jgi:hypothetical protein
MKRFRQLYLILTENVTFYSKLITLTLAMYNYFVWKTSNYADLYWFMCSEKLTRNDYLYFLNLNTNDTKLNDEF